MDWCQEYAFHNRRVMMDLLAGAVEHVTGKTPHLSQAVNIHHNYCQCEQCSWKVRQLDLSGTCKTQRAILFVAQCM